MPKKSRKPARAAAKPEAQTAPKPGKAKIILPKIAKPDEHGPGGGQKGPQKKGQGHAQTFKPAPPRLPGRNG